MSQAGYLVNEWLKCEGEEQRPTKVPLLGPLRGRDGEPVPMEWGWCPAAETHRKEGAFAAMAFGMLFLSMLLKALAKSTVRRHDESVGR